MADHADRADEVEEVHKAAQLRNIRLQAKRLEETLNRVTGKCLNCDAALDQGRFCDVDCRVDFEQRISARARS